MARTARRRYVPLDVAFFDDDKVVAAGEQAAVLYLAMLCRIKHLDADGVLTKAQMPRLGIAGWQKRLRALLANDLVIEAPGGYQVLAWLNWNQSTTEREAAREADRERKRKAAEAREKSHLAVVEGDAR